MRFIIGIIILNLLTIHSIMAQDLSDYQWKNRILLLLTNDMNSQEVSAQISEFKVNKEALEERKLLTFLITSDKTYMGLNLDEAYSNSSFYKKYKVSEAPFEMVLIGLDGGVKKRYTGYEPIENIFGLIDGMPMRRSELRRKKE